MATRKIRALVQAYLTTANQSEICEVYPASVMATRKMCALVQAHDTDCYRNGENMIQELQVGVITQTHGIRGEVKVFPTTDDVNRFKKLKEVTLDNGKERLVLEIEGVKFFKQYVILKFKGLDSINDIEKYKRAKLLVNRENAVRLRKNEYFIADLIGMEVMTDEGRRLGTLKDVLLTGANDVYVVERENGVEVLLPAIKECILEVDMEKGCMTVHVLDGLLEEDKVE